jgi:hypothetical protein
MIAITPKEGGEAPPSDGKLIADAISFGLKFLGNGNASTPMGAIETHGVMIKEAGEAIADALLEVAKAIENHGRKFDL